MNRMVVLGDLFWYLHAYYLKDAGLGHQTLSSTALSAAGSWTPWTFKVSFKAIIGFACLCSLRTCLYPHEVKASSLLLIFLPSVLPDVVRTGEALHPGEEKATPPNCSALPQNWFLPLFGEICNSCLATVKVWVQNKLENSHPFSAKIIQDECIMLHIFLDFCYLWTMLEFIH